MIISFYSYKGGVGRTQLCANLAAYLCYKKKKRVLLWDWDWEAPGLHYFFIKNENSIIQKGTLEILENYVKIAREKRNLSSSDLEFFSKEEVINLYQVDDSTARLDLLPCGDYNSQFHERAMSFDWFEFYEMLDGRYFFEYFKKYIKENLDYDYVLIDSRTGFSDYTGTCNIHLPDLNIIVLAPNEQNFDGSLDMIKKIQNSPYILESHKREALILPILSRLDTEHQNHKDWEYKFIEKFSYLIKDFDDFEGNNDFVDIVFREIYFLDTYLQYSRNLAFGENIVFDTNENQQISKTTFEHKYVNIANYIEEYIENKKINFLSRIDESLWNEILSKAKMIANKRIEAIALTHLGTMQIGIQEERDYFQQAIKIDESYYLANLLLADNYYNSQNYQEAHVYYVKYIKLERDKTPKDIFKKIEVCKRHGGGETNFVNVADPKHEHINILMKNVVNDENIEYNLPLLIDELRKSTSKDLLDDIIKSNLEKF